MSLCDLRSSSWAFSSAQTNSELICSLCDHNTVTYFLSSLVNRMKSLTSVVNTTCPTGKRFCSCWIKSCHLDSILPWLPGSLASVYWLLHSWRTSTTHKGYDHDCPIQPALVMKLESDYLTASSFGSCPTFWLVPLIYLEFLGHELGPVSPYVWNSELWQVTLSPASSESTFAKTSSRSLWWPADSVPPFLPLLSPCSVSTSKAQAIPWWELSLTSGVKDLIFFFIVKVISQSNKSFIVFRAKVVYCDHSDRKVF